MKSFFSILGIILNSVYGFLVTMAGTYYSWVAYVRFRSMGAKVGKNLKVFGWLKLHLRPNARIIIGDNVAINSGFFSNPVGGFMRMSIWVERGGELIIEDGAGMSNSTIVCTKAVRIGRRAFIGGGCKIYDTDFHAVHFKDREENIPGKSAPVLISDFSFIGGHCIILKGVNIGHGSVLGAGSVVTKKIPPNEIWAGNPARYIKNVE